LATIAKAENNNRVPAAGLPRYTAEDLETCPESRDFAF
jgi:hypothetical protein